MRHALNRPLYAHVCSPLPAAVLARDPQSVIIYDAAGQFVGVRRPGSGKPIVVGGVQPDRSHTYKHHYGRVTWTWVLGLWPNGGTKPVGAHCGWRLGILSPLRWCAVCGQLACTALHTISVCVCKHALVVLSSGRALSNMT